MRLINSNPINKLYHVTFIKSCNYILHSDFIYCCFINYNGIYVHIIFFKLIWVKSFLIPLFPLVFIYFTATLTIM